MEISRYLKEKVDPFYRLYKEEPDGTIKQLVLDSLNEIFPEVLKESQLEQLTGDIPGMTGAQARAEMQAYYQKEAVRILDGKKVAPFGEYFYRNYVYSQKKTIIDQKAVQYAGGDRQDLRLREWIWIKTDELYDHIKSFNGIGEHRKYNYQVYENADEWMMGLWAEVIAECIGKYSADSSDSFVNYLIWIYKKRLVSESDKMTKVAKRELSSDKIGILSDIAESSAETSEASFAQTMDDTAVDIWEKLIESLDEDRAIAIFNLAFGQILALIIELYDHNGKKKATAKVNKADYFRFFFTENIVDALKIFGDEEIDFEGLEREAEIINTMDQKLLDYIMTQICRSFELISEIPLKKYDDILKDDDQRMIKIPLNEKVYTQFIKEVLKQPRNQKAVAASISKYRALYKVQLGELRKGMGNI